MDTMNDDLGEEETDAIGAPPFKSMKCGACSHEFKVGEAHRDALAANGKRVACPDCGSSRTKVRESKASRIFSRTVALDATVRESDRWAAEGADAAEIFERRLSE